MSDFASDSAWAQEPAEIQPMAVGRAEVDPLPVGRAEVGPSQEELDHWHYVLTNLLNDHPNNEEIEHVRDGIYRHLRG